MKEMLSFIKLIQEYFYQLKTKGKEDSRVFTRVLVIYNYLIVDLAEMLKEEFGKLKLFMKPQPIQYYATKTMK